MLFFRCTGLFVAVITLCTGAEPAPPRDLFDGFSPGWQGAWRTENLFARPTRYEVVTQDGRSSLHATSESANAGLVRKFTVSQPTVAQLSWRWKIRAPLTGNRQERRRSGDDYAARVCVVFESSLLPLLTKSIHYVWSAHEPVGSIFPSPYSANVGMIVQRSGIREAGQWVAEQRDVRADYEAYFGEPPSQISAVAVVVDTDNTGLQAEAWLADLRLATSPPSHNP